MATIDIPIDQLELDVQNPRFPEEQPNQREAIRMVAKLQGRKLLKLAQDIVDHGPNPADSLIVMKRPRSRDIFTVLEGNRRLATLRILENPGQVEGAVSSHEYKEFKRLSALYNEGPVETLAAVILSREDAEHWIRLRHTGENEGAGIVDWESAETSRFMERSGVKQPSSQLIDRARDKGLVDPRVLEKFPTSSLTRLLGTPEVRQAMGIDVIEGQVYCTRAQADVDRTLAYVLNDIKSNINVKDIYHAPQRRAYAEKIAKAVPPKKKDLKDPKPMDGSETSPPKRRKRRTSSGTDRRCLIPRDCDLDITQPRLAAIAEELQKRLDLEQHTNAVAVLFRVFLDLSLTVYINKHGVSIDERAALSGRLRAVGEDLLRRDVISAQQMKAVRAACQASSFLAPSVVTLQEWMHNEHFYPTKSELKAKWDSLQGFFVGLWS